MEREVNKRKARRITAGYSTEIIYEDKRYAGVIENLSAHGANVLTDPLDPGVVFTPDSPIELKIETPSEEIVIIKCTIMWATRIPPHNIRHRIGMEISELPWNKIGMFL